jgi:predicted unusual protein kinase regulating ubiquinone biosynthesis (AarF/ABC1/UbiB family)
VPFLTKITQILLTGGLTSLQDRDAEVARDARILMEKRGPTYVKAGQMMSVRPDIIGTRAMVELAKLQDGVPRFDSAIARKVLETELGRPIDEVFIDFPAEPVAAASLAQVYRATLRATGEVVAVKVQRPAILETVSKDLYVLRRAAEVYQGLIDRFAPQQNTNYVALLNEWAVGFYTELGANSVSRGESRCRAEQSASAQACK